MKDDSLIRTERRAGSWLRRLPASLRHALLGLAGLALAGCANSIHRTSRPTHLIMSNPVTQTILYGGHSVESRIPAGIFLYAWEDESYWYYEKADAEFYFQRPKGEPLTGQGGFAVRKRYDEIAVYTYQDAAVLRLAGVSEQVLQEMKKRNGKLVSFEFWWLPEPVQEQLRVVGRVPLK